MVDLVISQQLGKWQRTQGFIKKMSAALSLALFLMKLSVFVVLCHVFSIPFCSARGAYSKFVFMGVAGWLIQPRTREGERQTLKREKKTERDRNRDRERQRRAVTSDAVCPHLISACFQPS